MQNIELIFCIFFRCFFRRAGVTYINRVAWLHAGEFGSVVQPSAGRTKGARSAAGCSRSREKDRNARFTRYRLRRLLSEQTTHAVRRVAAILGRKTATRVSLDTASAGCCPNKQRTLCGSPQPLSGERPQRAFHSIPPPQAAVRTNNACCTAGRSRPLAEDCSLRSQGFSARLRAVVEIRTQCGGPQLRPAKARLSRPLRRPFASCGRKSVSKILPLGKKQARLFLLSLIRISGCAEDTPFRPKQA